MADIIKKATNKFTKGLVMDFSPENTSNEVLTNALNATLLTFNGNELSLQNDMGNARVETAFLPEGYIPVGSCEYGGIIYIVSYNPLEDKSQIGCFPSPERNISSDELGMATQRLTSEDFVDTLGNITHNTKSVLLKEDKLNPGDKFIISATESIYQNALKDLLQKDSDGVYKQKDNPIIALNIVSIEDSGKIVYLNSDVMQYKNGDYSYYILGKKPGGSNLQPTDIDSYRSVVCSGYNVFKSKTSGKLAILAELIMVDSYSVTHSIKQNPLRDNQFDIYIHTEIEPQLTNDNYASCPKLKYYYLQKSQGSLQIYDKDKNPSMVSLFMEEDGVTSAKLNQNFLDTTISSIYNSSSQDLQQPLNLTGKFHFPKSGYYHGNMQPTNTKGEDTYTKFYAGKYHRLSKSQIVENNNTELLTDYYLSELRANFYKYKYEKEYTRVPEDATLDDNKDYYVEITETVYHDVKRNPTYRNEKVLYKLVTEPYVATKKEIEDTTIEKYLAVTQDLYIPATPEQIENWEREELWIALPNGYEKNTEEPVAGKEYYIKSTVTEWRSIGSDIDENNYTGVIYYFAQSKDYLEATDEDLEKYWDTTTYPIAPLILYRKTQSISYVLATEEQKLNYKTYNIVLYYKEEYSLVNDSLKNGTYTDSQGQLFIVVPMDTYVSYDVFKPDENYNYIEGYAEPANKFPKDDPITLHKVADFIPESDVLEYEDVKFADITIPRIIHDNKYSFPFKYDYTIVPCMNYGKLAHLAVSNTIDFSKLYSFSQSDFNVWKYHIDENQLRLTFGAEIYDTIEENKVDALILEFYDLRGFAGSLEICDKKAYSGVFTKLLSLNTVNTLSNKKVHNNNYITTFKRNAGIIQKEDSKYYLNNKEVYYSGAEEGWRYASDSTALSDSENDCGILYSNILYGVRTYLRVTDNNNYVFIPKTQFFLYTLPIYNKYYYTCDNFNELEYPELDLMLTYKLEDASTIRPYSSENTPNGYGFDSYELIETYLKGESNESTIKTTKYYLCKGVSNLYLEVGLKKEYSDFNMQYDNSLGKYFECTLKLLGNNADTTYSVQSDSTKSEKDILNHYDLFDDGVNKLGFNSTFDLTNTVREGQLQYMGFLYNDGNAPIPINYEFIVGYNVSIDDIKQENVQTKTVSALFHQKDGVYNYEDFGIYYQDELDEFDSTDGNGNPVSDTDRHYKCDQMIFSEGDAQNVKFGLCRQIKTSGDINRRFSKTYEFTEAAYDYNAEGLLYSGMLVKQIMPHVGKLAFCLPHVHGLSTTNGVNVTYSTDGKALVIHPYLDDNDKNDEGFTRGIAPGSNGSTCPIQDSPQCSMGLLTKQTVLYNSEYISTIQLAGSTFYTAVKDAYVKVGTGKDKGSPIWYKERGDEARTAVSGMIFKGIQGYQLCKYNNRLLNLMSNVYGYNPDYDTYPFKVGTINVENNNVKFVSSLLSIDSNLSINKYNKEFNDFIYFGGVNVSTYIQDMYKFSDNKISIFDTIDGELTTKTQIAFKPSFTYCGSANQGFLVTTLNYNVPTPVEIAEELGFTKTNSTVVKHSDGTNVFVNGVPNKKHLYSWDQDSRKLIQLDVSNYSIDQETGKLTLKKNLFTFSKDVTFIQSGLGYACSQNSFGTYVGYGSSSKQVAARLAFDISNQYLLSGTALYVVVPASNKNFKIPLRAVPKEVLNGVSVQLKSGSISSCECIKVAEDFNLLNVSSKDLQTLVRNSSKLSISYNSSFTDSIDVSVQNSGDAKFILCKLGFSSIHINYSIDPKLIDTSDFIEVNQTTDYAYFDSLKLTSTDTNASLGNYVYTIKNSYKNTVIPFTSITLNDLVYEGSSTDHRLFMKDNCYKAYAVDDSVSNMGGKARLQIYYRPLDHNKTSNNGHYVNDQWDYDKYKNYNVLHLHLGPSYIV